MQLSTTCHATMFVSNLMSAPLQKQNGWLGLPAVLLLTIPFCCLNLWLCRKSGTV